MEQKEKLKPEIGNYVNSYIFRDKSPIFLI